jgi:hypothetical protein
MAWTGTELLLATERLSALCVLLQSLEWLQVRAVFSDQGVWRYALLAPEQRALPLGLDWLCRASLPYPRFVALLGLRCAAALLVIFLGESRVWPFLCVSQILVCVRFRGASNGGSDSMSVVLASALSLPALFGRTPLAIQAALLYIGVQVTLSYVLAGLAKLRQPDWRDGRALQHFVLSSPYGAPAWLQRLMQRRLLARASGWAVIAFECLFPLAWLDPRLCIAWLLCGVVFHAVNVFALGLNRFFWAWLAAYPALLASTQLARVLSGFAG